MNIIIRDYDFSLTVEFGESELRPNMFCMLATDCCILAAACAAAVGVDSLGATTATTDGWEPTTLPATHHSKVNLYQWFFLINQMKLSY